MTMNAYVINRFGGPEVFEKVSIPRPEPKAGEVLIRVKATSVNPVDYKIRSGVLGVLGPKFPAVLHGDVAGVVEAVGSAVTAFKKGDEVYGCIGGVGARYGALAEYTIAESAMLAKKPSRLTMKEAASLPLVSITAFEALIDRAGVGSGHHVLVYGGTGGVGHVALQIAKAFGARVATTVSSEKKAEIAKSLGADDVANYKAESVANYVARLTDGRGFDVVFDTIGDGNLKVAADAARLNGHVVTILGPNAPMMDFYLKGLNLHFVLMLIPLLHGVGVKRHGEILTKVAELVDQGKIKPVVDPKVFTLDQVGAAHEYASSGEQIGKVVIGIGVD